MLYVKKYELNKIIKSVAKIHCLKKYGTLLFRRRNRIIFKLLKLDKKITDEKSKQHSNLKLVLSHIFSRF